MDLEPMPVTLRLILASLSANEIKIDATIPPACMRPHET